MTLRHEPNRLYLMLSAVKIIGIAQDRLRVPSLNWSWFDIPRSVRSIL